VNQKPTLTSQNTREVFTFGPELDLCPLISESPTG
jgi:hypothetical protein